MFPMAYFKELEKRNISFGMGGIKFSVLPQMHDPETRLRDMEQYRVDMQVLSIGPPGIDLEGTTPELSVMLARIVNDELARVVAKYPDKFAGMACLPLKRPEEAVQELARAVKELGLKGANIFSNVDGRPLDGPEFIPLFAKAVEVERHGKGD